MFLDLPECSKESGQLVSLGQLYELGQGRARPQYRGLFSRLVGTVPPSGALLPEIPTYNLSSQLGSFWSLLLSVPMVKPFKDSLGNSLLWRIPKGGG